MSATLGQKSDGVQVSDLGAVAAGASRAIKIVFILNGISGSGKTTAANDLAASYGVPAALKFSDRISRSGATGVGDPVCVSRDDFTRIACRPRFYAYVFGGFRYGFSAPDIACLLTLSEAVSVITADHAVIRALQADFTGVAHIVPVFIKTDHDVVVQRLRSAAYPEAEIQNRIARSTSIIAAYEAESDLYQVVINNNGTWSHFERQLAELACHFGLRRRAVVAA